MKDISKTYKNKILRSLNIYLGLGNSGISKDMKKMVNFDQIPLDIYQKVESYHDFETELPKDTYIETFRQKLKYVGMGFGKDFLGIFGFIELIGTDEFSQGTSELYQDMLKEIRSLPNIENSDNTIRDYNIFRETISRRESPYRNLNLVLPSRHLEKYLHYQKIFN